jgi:hypothetical protein
MSRLIIDIATNRVTYFTDDMEKPLTLNTHVAIRDWLEPLPTDMKLNNCWNWRVKGNILENTEGPPKTPETLFEQNKKSVKQLLIDKIDDARRKHFPKTIGDEWIKKQLLSEAQQGSGALLSAMAMTKNKDISVVAQEIINANNKVAQDMIQTEILKLQYQQSIDQVTEDSALWALRDEIANRNYLN